MIATLTQALRPVPGAGTQRGVVDHLGPDPSYAELPDHYSTDAIIALTSVDPVAPVDVTTEPSASAFDSAPRGGSRGRKLTPAMLDALQPHVINLTQGRFSSSGTFETTADDVERIFEGMLPKALQTARDLGEPLHIVFYAHGGLVGEDDALRTAYRHLMWWKQAPNVYPIHFVWETDILSTLSQNLGVGVRGLADEQARAMEARGLGSAVKNLLAEALDDRVEDVARLVARPLWTTMKGNARFASTPTQRGAPGGDAAVVAEALASFVKRFSKRFNEDAIQLHAIGHSAGAVFHNYFVPIALAKGAKEFKSVHYLAPAVRVDRFKDYVGALVGEKVKHCTIYTMTKHQERADRIKKFVTLYRKSLLYLIHYALEDRRKTPILGLDVSLRSDDALKTLFGLHGRPSEVGNVVFSDEDAPFGPSSSRALSHGDFDTDPWTLHSLFRRIVGRAPDREFQPEPRDRAVETYDDAAFEALLYQGMDSTPPSPASQPPRPAPTLLPFPASATMPSFSAPSAPPLRTSSPSHGMAGRRLALCVGIDSYPQDPLGGCVNDANAWARMLQTRGFEIEMLLNEDATYERLVAELQTLVGRGEPGDVLVFQFSGHGTFFLDLDGDEESGEDQAFCPVDFRSGPTLLDDDVRELYAQLEPSVNLTSFIDCCHSGSITRMVLTGDRRVRSVPPNLAMKSFRNERLQAFSSRRAFRSAPAMRDVAFSASQPHELAFETRGLGDF
ncbi:MAG: caspase family protein, partial [Bacteroidota bacterium]